MTNEQLKLILNLIADKIEHELLPSVRDNIIDGERFVIHKYKWVGEGEEPPFSYSITPRGNDPNWRRVDESGQFIAVIEIETFADQIRNMGETL